VVRETWPNERRVALTPANTALLLKKGFQRVLVERGAGVEAQFPDAAYQRAGATLSESSEVWKASDIIMKVRAPSFDGPLSEADRLREGATLISFVYPAQNQKVVEKLASSGVTSFAMDMVPRISRAQVFDALSSMANIAGYKAVLEASNHFGRFLTGQVTAAGYVMLFLSCSM
jgi:NAD(P) transhydrogenase